MPSRILPRTTLICAAAACLAGADARGWQQGDSSARGEARQINPAIVSIEGLVNGKPLSGMVAPGEQVIIEARNIGTDSGELKAAWKVGDREVSLSVSIESWTLALPEAPGDSTADAATKRSAAVSTGQPSKVHSAVSTGDKSKQSARLRSTVKSQEQSQDLSKARATARVPAGASSDLAGTIVEKADPYMAVHRIVARMPAATEIGDVDDLKLELWLETATDPPSARKSITWAYLCQVDDDCDAGHYCSVGEGRCRTLVFSCAGRDDHVLRRSDGVERDCRPYACDREMLKCFSTCNSQAQCATGFGFRCGPDGTCIRPD